MSQCGCTHTLAFLPTAKLAELAALSRNSHERRYRLRLFCAAGEKSGLAHTRERRHLAGICHISIVICQDLTSRSVDSEDRNGTLVGMVVEASVGRCGAGHLIGPVRSLSSCRLHVGIHNEAVLDDLCEAAEGPE
jgi:hypothetical protein